MAPEAPMDIALTSLQVAGQTDYKPGGNSAGGRRNRSGGTAGFSSAGSRDAPDSGQTAKLESTSKVHSPVSGDIIDVIDQVSAACHRHEEAIRRLKRSIHERVAQVNDLLQKLLEVDHEHAEYLESFRFTHQRNSQDIHDGIESLKKDSKASVARLSVVERRVEEMKETVEGGRHRLDVLKQALDTNQNTSWHLKLLSSRNAVFAGGAVAVMLFAILYRWARHSSATVSNP